MDSKVSILNGGGDLWLDTFVHEGGTLIPASVIVDSRYTQTTEQAFVAVNTTYTLQNYSGYLDPYNLTTAAMMQRKFEVGMNASWGAANGVSGATPQFSNTILEYYPLWNEANPDSSNLGILSVGHMNTISPIFYLGQGISTTGHSSTVTSDFVYSYSWVANTSTTDTGTTPVTIVSRTMSSASGVTHLEGGTQTSVTYGTTVDVGSVTYGMTGSGIYIWDAGSFDSPAGGYGKLHHPNTLISPLDQTVKATYQYTDGDSYTAIETWPMGYVICSHGELVKAVGVNRFGGDTQQNSLVTVVSPAAYTDRAIALTM